jgi:hypothetical protein
LEKINTSKNKTKEKNMNKTKVKKFTFKNEPKLRGLMAVGGGTPSINVKFGGVEIGYISFHDRYNDNRDLGIRVHLMVPRNPTRENPSGWGWIMLKKQFVSGEEAKEFLNEHFQKISEMILVQTD